MPTMYHISGVKSHFGSPKSLFGNTPSLPGNRIGRLRPITAFPYDSEIIKESGRQYFVLPSPFTNFALSKSRSIRMEPSIYSYSLCVALPLMLFFGFYFLFARTPDRAIYDNYLRSRRIMGVAMLLLAANYSVHFFSGIRFKNADAAILMNLSTYFLCYWLFSSALTTLLDRFYITKRRLRTHVGLWVVFSALSCVALLWLPKGSLQTVALLALATWLVVYGLVLARRLLRAYHKANRIFRETQAEDIGAYIRWLSIFTYWAVIFGVGCGLLTFLPDEYVYIWVLSSIPFYGYLFHSYQNYMLFYEQVERSLEIEDEPAAGKEETYEEKPKYFEHIENRLTPWLESNGYIQPGLTIQDLAKTLDTNRTYLIGYIKDRYGVSFREWITALRLEYAKKQIKEHPEISVQKLAEASGFLSRSYFIKSFTAQEGCTPARWRKAGTN